MVKRKNLLVLGCVFTILNAMSELAANRVYSWPPEWSPVVTCNK